MSASNTDHGQAIFKNLQLSSPSNVIVAPAGDGPAVLSYDVYDAARTEYDRMPKRPHEKVLVGLYTPCLMDIIREIHSELRLVNSEFYQWLRCMSGYRKADLMPDLFSAHFSLVEYAPAYNGAPVCAVPRLFGRFSPWDTRASIHCIWDAKWEIDMAAFGEKCKYLQIIGEDSVDHNGVALKLKGILFDIDQFWMIRSSGNTIVDVVQCKWMQPGSKQILKEFLQVSDPWMTAASALCTALGVTIVDYTAGDQKQCAFIGAGANGRVFRLTSGAVIKVVIGRRSDELEKEFLLMLQCQNRIDVQALVFPVVDASFRSGSVNDVAYAGYLLAREGEQIVLPVSTSVKLELAVLLHGLHNSGVIHGDPRVENAIRLDGLLKWIDFRLSETVTTKISRRRDVHILLGSIGGNIQNAAEKIEAYVNDPSVQNLQSVLLM